MPTFSIIVPTIGRPSLVTALQSLAGQPLLPGDEVIVVGAETPFITQTAEQYGCKFFAHAPGGDYGYTERWFGIERATADYLAFLDDDDIYLPGAFDVMRAAATAYPDRPLMFRMVAPWGETLWRTSVACQGNVGGAQFVTPNNPARLGRFTDRYEADYDFIMSTLLHYPEGALVWNSTVTYRCSQQAEAA